MSSTTNPDPHSEEVDLTYRYCATPRTIECDGIRHYWAIWDEDVTRWVPVDGACPHRGTNRAIVSYDRFRDDGLSHADAVAHVRAHGGDL